MQIFHMLDERMQESPPTSRMRSNSSEEPILITDTPVKKQPKRRSQH